MNQLHYISKGVWKRKKSYVKLSKRASSNTRITLRKNRVNTLEW